MSLNELTIHQASDGIREKKFSVVELVSDCLAAVQEKDKDIHSYLEVFDDALDQAKKADSIMGDVRTATGLGSLFGMPVAIKDNILVEGRRCTAGSKILESYTACYDATVIERLKAQGAVIIGKTNLDEFAMGSSTEYSAFGPTKNPHDVTRVPGGSSGGSAAGVAAHFCVAALGSDTGGSIRQPSSFCGVVGMKPTYGAVSRHGLIAMASSLDQIGPIAKSVKDARIVFEAIAGRDDFDSTSVFCQKSKDKRQTLEGVVVGVPKEYFSSGLDEGVLRIIKSAVKKIEGAGARVEEISLPHSHYALSAYYIVVSSEVSANLARFDGIRYGYSGIRNSGLGIKNLYDVYAKTRARGFGAEVKRRVMLGTYALSAGYYDAYYLKAQKVRSHIKNDFDRAFERVNVILGPTTPSPAFAFGEKSGNPLEMYLADIYTVAVNLAGVPALSLPAGSISQGNTHLPVGLQLIGPRGEDFSLLDIAERVESLIHNS